MVQNGHNLEGNDTPRSLRAWHLKHVYSDPDFLAEFAAIDQLEADGKSDVLLDKLRDRLARKYALSTLEMMRFIGKQHLTSADIINMDSSCTLYFDAKAKKWSFQFDAATLNRADLLAEYKRFEVLRQALFPQPPSRRRPPENPELVYRIFKARKAGLIFREIFDAYSVGQLDGYKGSTTQFRSEDSLETYYQKYRPDKTNT